MDSWSRSLRPARYSDFTPKFEERKYKVILRIDCFKIAQANILTSFPSHDIIPIVLTNQNTKRTSRKKGKTAILTEFPSKTILQDYIALTPRKAYGKREEIEKEEILKLSIKETSVEKRFFIFFRNVSQFKEYGKEGGAQRIRSR